MLTPLRAPSCLAHMPAQLTTNSASIVPRVVVTPVARPVGGGDARDRHALDDLHALLARAFGQGHGGVHGIDAPVLLQIKARLDVVHPGQGEEPLDLVGADLLDVVAAESVEGRDPAILLHAVRVRGQLDEAQRLEAGARARSPPRGGRRDRACTCASPPRSPRSSRRWSSGPPRARSCPR